MNTLAVNATHWTSVKGRKTMFQTMYFHGEYDPIGWVKNSARMYPSPPGERELPVDGLFSIVAFTHEVLESI